MKRFVWGLVPLALVAVLVYTQLQVGALGSVGPGGKCSQPMQCSQAAPICSITDQGVWIFGIEGFCTNACDPKSETKGKKACPPPLECKAGQVTFWQGTRWKRQWITQSGNYCAPPG
jgi:hypothetical protein